MGLISRFIGVVKAKLNIAVSAAEDPVEQLELRYEEMKGERRNIKESVTDLKTQRKRLEKKVESLQQDVDKHNSQARKAMEQGREDLAADSLVESEMETLRQEVDDSEEGVELGNKVELEETA